MKLPGLETTARLGSGIERLMGSYSTWWCICLVVASIYAASGRHYLNPDGLSYIDMAAEAVEDGPHHLVSDYWSPAYPALLAVAFAVFRPTASQEVPLVHFVNLLVFCVALLAFSGLVRQLCKMSVAHDGNGKSGRPYLIAVSFTIFLWSMIQFIGMDHITPDLAVAAIGFLAIAISIRLELQSHRRFLFLLFGFVLGVGFYIKAAMFPLGLMLIALICLRWSIKRIGGVRNLALSLAAFLLTVAPLTGALSAKAGRLSIGEAGRLNYLWYVNGALWADDVDRVRMGETVEHPAPRIVNRPITLHFPVSAPGTYPLWFNPAHWYAAASTRVDPAAQIRSIATNLEKCVAVVQESALLAAGAAALLILKSNPQTTLATGSGLVNQIAWPLAATLLYLSVTVEIRYLGGFIVLFWQGVYCRMGFRNSVRGQTAVVGLVITGLLSITALRAFGQAQLVTNDLRMARDPEYVRVGKWLGTIGVKEGHSIAIVGYAHNCYYARYARLRVGAQIPSVNDFRNASASESALLVDTLARLNIRAILTRFPPSANVPGNWERLASGDGSEYAVLLIRPMMR